MNSPEITFEDDDNFDYGPEHKPVASNEAMAKLHERIELAVKGQEYIAGLKEKLKTAEARLKDILEKEIPHIMENECSLTHCVSNGLDVELKREIYASLPAMSTIANEKDEDRRQELQDKRDAGIKWLEENGHEDIIKRNFLVEFGRDDQAWANKFRADLKKRKNPLPMKEGEEVNFQTLSALVRSLAEAHEDYPAEVLGVFHKVQVKIKPVKAKKRK